MTLPGTLEVRVHEGRDWAGPGNNHAPAAAFQSQTATMDAANMQFAIPANGSHIAYAPTNSCASTTTEYDKNLNHTLDASEGAGMASELDKPTGTNTVQQEIVSRGFAVPSLF